MKVLESSPSRYDRGIDLISLGQAGRIKKRIVDNEVIGNDRVLEIGCGTGTFAIMAAKKGTHVTGFDVSSAMLDVARKKVEKEALSDKIALVEMGVSGMDSFEDSSFDLVVSTLVFSELSPDERKYALQHSLRLLKPGGKLVLADEVKPDSFWRRFIHAVIRIPLTVFTYVLTQTTTRAVDGLKESVREAGFEIIKEERLLLGSFLYLVNKKEDA